MKSTRLPELACLTETALFSSTVKREVRLLLALLLCGLLLTGCGGVTGSANRDPGQNTGGGNIQAVNHVIIMLQQNRTFDHYFGQMTAYRQRNNIPIVSSDGRINDLSTGNFFNPVELIGPIPVAHSGSVCTETLSSDWAESHKEMNLSNPSAAGPNAPMDGFAQTAFDVGLHALTQGITLTDQTGSRAMHYYDDSDLNYYYFMASNFAMSDALFTPLPSRFPNRLFLHAATTQGHARGPNRQLTARTIWESLDAAGLSWKIYMTDGLTYLEYFTYFNRPETKARLVPLSEYFTDVQNGTLPAVALIEPGLFSGRDEHPSNFNPTDGTVSPISVQTGAAFVASLINALMVSPSWRDSVFFLAYDEGGGFFDHVPPISVPNPDGIPPQDLLPNDPVGDFTITGFRVPNMVISPFAKRNYVSHTPMDLTAYLKFIETRWGLPPLTARDAAMPDMTEFFDFTGVPWAIPPSPPAQNTNGACDFTRQ
ncbi:MAG TPA: alkaline phosphatase family protein [Terriglobales bacterium]|nr:alkaline phosphatase family protein [Terriglobales bacterium]